MSVRLRGTWGAIVCLAILYSIVGLEAFAVQIEILSSLQEEAPGMFATHVFTLTNDTLSATSYSIEYDVPPGWGNPGAPTSVALEPGEETTLFVTLTIPPGAAAETYKISLAVRAEDDPSDFASATAHVAVSPINEVELLPPTGDRAAPGGTAEYDVVLVNRGNAQDSYRVEAFSSRGFTVRLSKSEAALAPQERVTLHLRLDVPTNAAPGRDVLTITATSLLYDTVEVDAAIFTTVLPPTPEAVGGTLMEQMGGRIRLSIDDDVLNGSFSSRLTSSLSGQIKGGYFSTHLSVSDPFGPDAAELGFFSILYRRDPITYTLGDVSARLTDLIRMSCRGGSVDIDETLYDVSFLAGGEDEETRFAGYLAFGPEEANLGLAYYGMQSTASDSLSVWSATAEAEPLEDWTIRVEGALGVDGPLTSRALFVNTTIDTRGYFLTGNVFSVGTYFPGSRGDSAGIEISQRLRLTDVSLSVSLQHVWDNVVGDPLVPTSIRDELGFNLRTTPLDEGPTLSATTEFVWDRYADPSQKSEIDALLAVGLTETGGIFPYSLSGKTTDQIDHVLDTHVRTTTYREGAGLSIDAFYLFFQLTQEKKEDLVNDLVLSASSDVSLRFRPESSLHEASITLRNSVDTFYLFASLFIRFIENLDIVFDGSISWDRGDVSEPCFGWGITFNATFDIPLPFFLTKGRINGRAFIDQNGNGAFDGDDRPADHIVVAADRSEVSTDADGYFRFPPFYPGTYTLTTRELPVDAAAAGPVEIELAAGQTQWIEIPLSPVVVVTGRLFDDADKDGSMDGDEGGFAQVRVLLLNESGSVANTFTDLTGRFAFTDVLPGRYTVTMDRESLPDRFVFTTADEISLDLEADVLAPLAFGGYVRPREVVITFQPPTADFTVSPEEPSAGVSVTFDGTLSFDFDGEIVAYSWDFDADGKPDASEAVVEYTFPEAGAYDVSLTVTDDSGNSDTLTTAIEVGAPGAPAISAVTLQPPVADFAYLPERPIAGETVRFDGTLSSDFDGTIVAYAWDFNGDGVVDATASITEYAFLEPGTYDVSLTVTDDGGNVDTITLTIEVSGETGRPSALQLPIADFVYTPRDPSPGETVTFNGTASLDLDGRIVSYAWDFDEDGDPDSTAAIVEHTFDEVGVYTIALTVTDNDGNIDTLNASIEVNGQPVRSGGPSLLQPPIADFSYMPIQPQAGHLVLFNGTFSVDLDGEIVAYAWDFDGDGQTDSTAVIAEHTFPESGVYPVSLSVTDNSGSRDTVTYPIHIQ